MEIMKISEAVREYLMVNQGKIVTVEKIRSDLSVARGSSAWRGIYTVMQRMEAEGLAVPTSRYSGRFKVIKRVSQIQVFGSVRERKPPVDFRFPVDRDTLQEFPFAEDLIIRGGDLIVIAGASNWGKTTLALNLAGENIDSHPILMGNEYTTIDLEPTPRFVNRLENMDWVQWVNGDGMDKFTLLPVREDYAEHIVRDRINIIDWINIETGEHFMIGTIFESIKRAVGNGVAIATIQKADGAESGRGGQFTKDFADVELLIDRLDDSTSKLTIGKVKESKCSLAGKTYAFQIEQGVKIVNFREIKKCGSCRGAGYIKGSRCTQCRGTKYVEIDGYGMGAPVTAPPRQPATKQEPLNF